SLTVRRPPESAPMREARRSALMPGPGRFLGQEVTMRHSMRPCASAGRGKAAPAAPAAPVAIRRRRLIAVRTARLSPEGVEVVYRALAMADPEAVGLGKRSGQIGLRLADRGLEREAMSEAGGNGGGKRAA